MGIFCLSFHGELRGYLCLKLLFSLSFNWRYHTNIIILTVMQDKQEFELSTLPALVPVLSSASGETLLLLVKHAELIINKVGCLMSFLVFLLQNLLSRCLRGYFLFSFSLIFHLYCKMEPEPYLFFLVI